MKFNKKIGNVLITVGVSSILATATYVIGKLSGYNKGKKEAVKISGKLRVVQYGKNNENPEIGLVLNDIKDLKCDYIVLEVDRVIYKNDKEDETNIA